MDNKESLGKDDSIFRAYCAGIVNGLMNEKRAFEIVDMMEKDAVLKEISKVLGNVTGMAKDALKGGFKAVSGVPSALAWTAAIGAGAGGLGALGYDALKENLTQEDPEEKFNSKVEAYYANKLREAEDARWLRKARAMRDNLVRNHGKMTPEEYSAEYNALLSILRERA